MSQQKEVIGYHFHIYYYPNDPADELAIDALFDEAKEKWGNDLRIVAWKQIIGPHTMPFFEIDIVGSELVSKYFVEVYNWVLLKCSGKGNGGGEIGRPVLLHPVFTDNSDQVGAHSIYSMWLGGRQVPINLKVLEPYDKKQ